MRRVVLDTNVLVSFLTDRDAEQQAAAGALFETAAAGEAELILHQEVESALDGTSEGAGARVTSEAKEPPL